MATEAVARLESAVENIRQLAQSHDIASGPVIVREAAGLALRHLERSWASRGARERVQVQIPNDLPLALADKRALARLLQLLLDNALKFSDDHKPVHVIAAPYQSGYVWVGVQDFGIGIAEEEHERIFDAFYQVDGSSTRRYGGTGTGLALAMLLAKSMRTAIQVESAPGKGSTFSFLLPVADLDALA
jgi:signal transduction histidine kinase